ncbi:MAG: MFS transporter [Candidatus Heimdallarchaeota archaeon]|nr:MFS transporter [Candidatus Heimdallarchaeota archaeon]
MVIEEEEFILIEKKLVVNDNPSIKNVLTNKSYMLVFSGQILNMIASILVGMTFSYLIYDTTHNASLMALMGILGALPTVLLVTFAGVIVDRFDQRKLIFITTLLRTILFAGYLVIYLFMDRLVQTDVFYELLHEGVIQRITIVNYLHFIWPIYTLLFINNVVFTLYTLTVSTYSKYIIEKKNLLVANSFNTTVNQLANVIGPILAGMIITVSYLLSFTVGIGIASIGSVVCLLLISKGKYPPIVKKEKTTFKKEVKRVKDDLKIGFNTIRFIPKVLYVTIVYTFFNLGTAFINGIFNVVLQGEMNMSATWFGSVIAVMSTIGIITSLIIMKLGKINRKLILINLVIFAEVIGLVLFALIRNPWIMLFVVTIPLGFVNGGANIPSFTLRQEKIPHEKLGRATSFSFMFTSLANVIGLVILTFIANKLSPMIILLISAGICFILVIISFIFYITKRSLRCSDYSDEIEVTIKQIDKEILEDMISPIKDKKKELLTITPISK